MVLTMYQSLTDEEKEAVKQELQEPTKNRWKALKIKEKLKKVLAVQGDFYILNFFKKKLETKDFLLLEKIKEYRNRGLTKNQEPQKQKKDHPWRQSEMVFDEILGCDTQEPQILLYHILWIFATKIKEGCDF